MRLPTTTSLILIILVLSCIAPPASAEGEKSALVDLKFKYGVERERLDKPMATLDASFKARLEKLEEEAAASGELGHVLAVREELKLLGKPGHAKAEGFAELQRFQAIYDKESQKIAAERDAKLEKLLASYSQRLETLQKELTRDKEIAEAVAAGKERDKVAAELTTLLAAKEVETKPDAAGKQESEFDWEPLGAARLLTAKDDPEIVGVESQKGLSAVYIRKAMPMTFQLKGECRVSGPWGGFVVGLSPRAGDFMAVYSGGTTLTRYEKVTGGSTRKGLGDDDELRWKADRWMKFELSRDRETWNLKLGSDRLEFTLPDGIDGRNIGLVSYSGSSVVVRKLKLSSE